MERDNGDNEEMEVMMRMTTMNRQNKVKAITKKREKDGVGKTAKN